ncbi:MAG: CDP-diacylglycerol O-phosphatidyltransferase [Naasia sp.]|nr:CDP-diacylglycerol O-phosphatidyltransferase [Naasia sp.]
MTAPPAPLAVPADAPSALPAKIAAAGVHLFTASGLLLALAMVHFAYLGDVRAVLWLFFAAMFVDGVDGFLARGARVKVVLPHIDGALLDNIVDFITYAFAPMVLLWATGYLPDGSAGGAVAGAVLLASAYQFSRTDAKTDDHFFRGFPSYWNIVAFYIVVLGLDQTATVVLLLVLAVASFVPIDYLYPSRTKQLWRTTMVLTTLWFVGYAAVVATMPHTPAWLIAATLAYVVYYTAVSLAITVQRRRATAAPVQAAPAEPAEQVEPERSAAPR